MSEKEFKRRKIAKAVMYRAWAMLKRCMLSWRTCLRVCWRIVRYIAPIRFSKLRGVTFGNRQEILQRLSCYRSSDIKLTLQREPDNPHDLNAILVIATVRNKGMAVVGYLSREISCWLAPLLDSGREVVVMIDCITGVNREDGLLGMNLEYVLL